MTTNRTKHNSIRLMALAAMLSLAACTAEHDGGEGSNGSSAATPITLAATVEQTATRGGSTGNIDLSVLAQSGYGFGVFASQLEWTNLPVSYNGPTPAENPVDIFDYPGSWTYGAQKYWTKDANGGPVDFFAYAPYTTTTTGTGITAIGADAANPTIGYTIATRPQESVDLLWGVKGATGLPWTSTTLASSGGPVLFTFHHALAAIGLHVQAIIDQDNDTQNPDDHSDVSGLLGTDYKITVKNITISGDFHQTGTLTLKNTAANTPLWGTPSGTETTLTVPRTQVNTAFRHPDETAITTAATAKTIMDGSMTGITQQPRQKVIAPHATSAAEQLFFLIPNATPQDYVVTVNWCVSHLRGGVYTAEDHTNQIRVNSLPLAAGTKYYLNLVFNLHTVHLNVTAEDWAGTSLALGVNVEHGTSASESLAKTMRQ